MVKPMVSPPGESDFLKSFNHSQRAVFSMELQEVRPTDGSGVYNREEELGVFSQSHTHHK
jgi:hypothetical protein